MLSGEGDQVEVGFDRDAPAMPPRACRRLGEVQVEAPNLKVSPTGELRAAARSLGGNTVVVRRSGPIRDRPVIYVGIIQRCEWFGAKSPSCPSGDSPLPEAPRRRP
jgi:hypothetical protein